MRTAVKQRASRFTGRARVVCAAVMLLTGIGWFGVPLTVRAANLNVRELRLESAVPGATTSYLFNIGYVTASSIGSVKLELCTNDPFIGAPCVAPAGLDASAAILADQAGETGFNIDPASTANVIVLARTAAVVAPGTSSYRLDQVVNPSASGTHYVRIETFATTDATGPHTDQGALAFSVTPALTVTTEVPPYLEFCAGITISGFSCTGASGDSASFGELSRTQTRTVTSQFMTTTNAAFGYAVTVAGNTMTAGNEVIPAMTGGAAVPGISQFGMNLRANSIPPTGQEPAGVGPAVAAAGYNQPNQFRFNAGDIVASAPGASDYQKFTATYILNMASGQAPGHYASTVSYICLANF